MGALYQTSQDPGEYVPFPELGSGSQFHVFDMHNGRVLKLPLTKQETYVVASKRRHNMNPLSTDETATLDARVQTIISSKSRIPAMLDHSFYDRSEFLQLLGNPSIIDTGTILPQDTPDKQWGTGRVIYTQDKLAMVGDMLNAFADLPTLRTGDINKIKQIIDRYIEQMYRLWEFGFSDYVFKIGDTGFDATGALVLADLGEYSSDAEFIQQVLADKRWLHSICPDKIDFPQIPGQLHEYFTQTLNNAFTPEQFQAHWRKKHTCSSCLPRSNDDVVSAFIAAKVAEIDYVDRW